MEELCAGACMAVTESAESCHTVDVRQPAPRMQSRAHLCSARVPHCVGKCWAAFRRGGGMSKAQC